MPVRALLASHSSSGDPAAQRRVERALLAAAALGETHLHVSSLGGDVLSLGAFQRAPSTPAAGAVWRRRTGGRAIACGAGFPIASLALPHRAALSGCDRLALRPEQVMNRAVRGLLAGLRALGFDPIYPGLDFVTVGRRAVAHLSFAEGAAGPTLVQAIVAAERSFALTPALLDRCDGAGAIAAEFLSASAMSSLAQAPSAGATGAQRRKASLPQGEAALLRVLCAGFRESFAVEPLDLDPEVTRAMIEQAADGDDVPPVPEAPPAEAGVASASGRLGPVSAWAYRADDRIARCGFSGDVIASEGALERAAAALAGASLAIPELRTRLNRVLDGADAYLLGLTVDALADLALRAAEAARAR